MGFEWSQTQFAKYSPIIGGCHWLSNRELMFQMGSKASAFPDMWHYERVMSERNTASLDTKASDAVNERLGGFALEHQR
jgi:hypothetical protein